MPLFPPVDRVVYGHNPLVQVICHLQFDELLEISQEEPVAFQRAIRDEYPVVERPSTEQGGEYHFVSAEGHWRITLASKYLSITTTEYERWELFQQRLSSVRESFEQIYSPPRYTRLGLRYTDIINRSEVGLDERDWSDLIDDQIAGIAVSEGFQQQLLSHHQRSVFELSEHDDEPDARLGLVFIIGETEDYDDEVAMIDADLFCPEPTRSHNADDRIDELHQFSGRVFRACITDRLHEALEPEPVEE